MGPSGSTIIYYLKRLLAVAGDARPSRAVSGEADRQLTVRRYADIVEHAPGGLSTKTVFATAACERHIRTCDLRGVRTC